MTPAASHAGMSTPHHLQQQKHQDAANSSPQVQYVQVMQAKADEKLLQQKSMVIQMRITQAHIRNMEYFFGKQDEAKQYLQSIGPEKAWKEFDTFIKGFRNSPTKEELAEYYNCDIEEPAAEEEAETSDIKQAYDVKKGCALQALIGYGQRPYGKGSALELHNHIWTTPALAAYKEYDINWEALYRSLGLDKIANPAAKIEDLPDGNYLCETPGHMVAVSVVDGTPTLHQDRGNAIGKAKDSIIQTYQ
ncbi:MAG: hypothetical protein AAF206_09670 [Bacteroidota bacterium]